MEVAPPPKTNDILNSLLYGKVELDFGKMKFLKILLYLKTVKGLNLYDKTTLNDKQGQSHD